MYARVARFEGADPQALRQLADDIRAQAASGPPEGVPAVGGTLLIDPEHGTSMAIMLFDTRDDMRKGHEALDAMTPTSQTGGHRVSVDMFEVALDIRPSGT